MRRQPDVCEEHAFGSLSSLNAFQSDISGRGGLRQLNGRFRPIPRAKLRRASVVIVMGNAKVHCDRKCMAGGRN